MNYIEILQTLLNKDSFSTFSLYVVSILYICFGYFNGSPLLIIGIHFFIFTTILIVLSLKDNTIKDKLSIVITPFNFLIISFFGISIGTLIHYENMIFIGLLTLLLAICIIVFEIVLFSIKIYFK